MILISQSNGHIIVTTNGVTQSGTLPASLFIDASSRATTW